MSFSLTTKRLQLRPCTLNDLALLHMLWTDEHMRYFLFDNRIISEAEAKSFIEASLDSFKQHCYGIWLAHDQDQWIGFVGLLQTEAAPTLIYGIAFHCWGQGYATEAAQAVLDYALQTLNLPKVVADVDEPNTASVQVLQKLGMNQVRRELVNGRPLLLLVSSGSIDDTP